MALSYRTPVETMCMHLPSRFTENINNVQVDNLLKHELLYGSFFNFNMNDEKKKFLVSKGIFLSPNSWVSHSHPACKTIENHLLFMEIRLFLEGLKKKKVGFVSLRDSKLRLLEKTSKKKEVLDKLVSYNRHITAKDRLRYAERTFRDENQFRECISLDVDKGYDTLVIHDEIHYWSINDTVDFLDATAPVDILATLVHPSEVNFGKKRSHLPELYEFEIDNQDLFFFPDGNRSEMYCQPKGAGWWLECSHIKTRKQGVYSVSIVRSIGPFHLLLITRGELKVEKKRFFQDFSLVDLGRFIDSRSDVDLTFLRASVFKKIILYIRSLKKPDKESVQSKLRMMTEDSICLEESAVLEKITGSLLKDGIRNFFDKGLSCYLYECLVDAFPDCFSKVVFKDEVIKRKNLETLLYGKELSFSLITRRMDSNTIWNRLVSELVPQREEDELCSLLKSNLHRGEFLYDNACGYETRTNSRKRYIEFTEEKECIFFKRVSWIEGVMINGKIEQRGELLNGFIQSSFKEKKVKGRDVVNAIGSGLVFHHENGVFLNKDSNVCETPFSFDTDRGSVCFQACQNALRMDKKRFEKACFESMNLCYTFDELYSFFVFGEFNNGVFRQKGIKVGFYPNKQLNKMVSPSFYLFLYFNFGLYCPHYTLNDCSDTDYRAREAFRKDPMNRLSEIIDSPTSEPINEPATEENIECCQDDLICNSSELSGSCAFIALSQSIGVNLENIICSLFKKKEQENMCQSNQIVAGELIKRLQDDNGLNVPEICSLFSLFGKSYVIMIEDNIVESNFSLSDEVGVFSCSRNHCEFICNKSKEESIILTEKSRFILGESSLIADRPDPDEEVKRSKRLFEAFQEKKTGVLLAKSILEKDKRGKKKSSIDTLCKNIDRVCAEDFMNLDNVLMCSMGFAGSGKSFEVKQRIKRRFGVDARVLVISPRKELLKDYEDLCDKDIHVTTFEKAFFYRLSDFDVFVLDEFSLYPRGYLSILRLTAGFDVDKPTNNGKKLKSFVFHKRSQSFVLVGDPLQVRYFSETDDGFLRGEDEIDFWLKLKGENGIPYLAYSMRLPSNYQIKMDVGLFGNATTGTRKTFLSVELAVSTYPESQLIVASRDEKKRFECYGALTIGECQGKTFDSVILALSPPMLLVSPNHVYVALTRTRSHTHFAMNGYSSLDEFLERSRGSLLQGAVGAGHMRILEHPILMKLGYKLVPIEKKKISQLDAELKMENDVYLKGMVPLCEYADHQVDCPEEVVEYLEGNKINLPIVGFNCHAAFVLENMKDRMEREFKDGTLRSEQFPDFFKTGEPGAELPGCSRYQMIYPKHSNSDSLTFLKAIKKRLRFSNPSKEREKFEAVRHLGEEMLNVFLERVPITDSFNHVFWEESQKEYLEKKVSKSKGTIDSHMNRSEPDWNIHHVFLFMKTQLCTKYEKRFCDAKAGQTLACFSHALLNRFAAPCRYIEKKIAEKLPKRFYIHQKKDFNQLNKWVIEQGFNGMCVESDYEAFDSSQDALVLALEYQLLKFLGWSDSLLDDYVEMKCNLGCRLGNLAIMRFTGEFGTFLFNTICNMVFTFMYYEDSGASICFAGDDMCANAPLVKRDGKYDHILRRMTLRAKVEYTMKPTFCGWRLTKFGLYKRPELVLERLLISKEKGNMHECINSYFLEFLYAFKLGEKLFQGFSEKELECHYLCTRVFVKERRWFNKSCSDIFEGVIRELGVSKRVKSECLLSRRKSSLKLTTMEERELTVSKQTASIRTLVSQETSLLTLLREMRVQYPLKAQKVATSSLEYRSYTMRPLRKRGDGENSNGSTLGPYPLASTSSVTMTQRKPEEQSSLLTEERKEGHVLLRLMTLTFQRNQPISYLPQMHVLISTMNCLLEPVRFMCLLKKTSTRVGQGHLELSSEPYSDLPMHSIVFINVVAVMLISLVVVIKRSTTPLDGIKAGILKPAAGIIKNGSGQEYISPSQLEVQGRSKEGRSSCRTREEEIPSTLSSVCAAQQNNKNLKELTQLGQVICSLMKQEQLISFWVVQLELPLTLRGEAQELNMAARDAGQRPRANAGPSSQVKAWIMSKERLTKPNHPSVKLLRIRRRMLLRMHLVTHLLKSFPNLGEDPTTWNAEQEGWWSKISHDFAALVFGNIAIYGFSEATVYPDQDIDFEFEYGDPVVRVSVTFNMPEIKQQFKYYADQSKDGYLRGLTWRQIGEAFAEDIRNYLKDIEPDARTWLVKSNPALAGSAPWVAVDVTGGLYKTLSPEERKVIARVNNHLLRTSKLKGSISESGEVYLES